MATTTRELSWNDILLRADPEHNHKKRRYDEYEFTAPRDGLDERTHRGNMRVFQANYDERGPYAPDDLPAYQYPAVSYTKTTEASWLQTVLRADPEHNLRNSRTVNYEFPAPSGPYNDVEHEDSMRVFRSDYRTTGAYSGDATEETGLTWNGLPLNWSGGQLTWGDE